MGTSLTKVPFEDDKTPIRMHIDDPEGFILEEECYASVSAAEEFVKTHYGNIPGVTAYMYELKEVYKVVENAENTDALEDLKQQIEALLDKANSAIAKIDTALKERR